MAGFFDTLLADPSTAQGMQNAGTFGGLQALGAALAAAGQMRPVGQPGPSLADAFTAYGTGRRQGLLGAQQNAQMARQQARQGLLSEARDANKPDEALSPQALAMRKALFSLPEGVRALADDEQLPQLAIKKGTEGVRPMTAAELAAGGYKRGSVVMVNDFTGAPNVVQASDVMSPEAEAQRLRVAAASRAPPSPVEVNGRLVDPRTGRVIYDGGAKPLPMNEGNAWNVVMRLAPMAKAGQLDPNSEEGRAYIAAQTVLTQPKPQPVVQPDGSTKLEYTTPAFPFTRLPVPGDAPPGGVGAGTTVKPPPPLTEAQGNATAYLTRMEAAEKRMDAAVAGGYSQGSIRDRLAASTPGVGNFLMSEKGQNYKQAQEDWVRAKLRKESGAVIADSEMAAEIKTYFPQPGDASSTIAQKAEARRTAMDALKASTGTGMDRVTTTPQTGAPSTRDPLGILK